MGDSLLEPFWPEGTGCARGFLSAMDAGWMMRDWFLGQKNPLKILAEREMTRSILNQTTDSNLVQNFKSLRELTLVVGSLGFSELVFPFSFRDGII